jgi:hypothetical protein
MRGTLFRLWVIALVVPLAGCLSVAGPKEVPGWAMAPDAGPAESVATPRRTVRRPRVADERSISAAEPTGAVVSAPVAARPAAASGGGTAYSPEGLAQDNAADERLRRQMNICRGC